MDFVKRPVHLQSREQFNLKVDSDQMSLGKSKFGEREKRMNPLNRSASSLPMLILVSTGVLNAQVAEKLLEKVGPERYRFMALSSETMLHFLISAGRSNRWPAILVNS